MAMETTIKVDRELRDRINVAAREQRMTPAQLIGVLLAEYEHERWLAGAVAEMNASPPDDGPEPPYPRPRAFDGFDAFRVEPSAPVESDPYPKPEWIRRVEAEAADGDDGS